MATQKEKVLDLVLNLSTEVSKFDIKEVAKQLKALPALLDGVKAEINKSGLSQTISETLDGIEAAFKRLGSSAVVSKLTGKAKEDFDKLATTFKTGMSGIKAALDTSIGSSTQIEGEVAKITAVVDSLTASFGKRNQAAAVKEFVNNLKQLRDEVSKGINAKDLEQQIASLTKSWSTAVSTTKSADVKQQLREQFQKLIDEATKVNPTSAKQHIDDAIKQIFENATKGVKLEIPPLSFSNIATDTTALGESLRRVQQVMGVLTADSENLRKGLKTLFKDDVQVEKFITAVSAIGPAFKAIEADQNSFGDRFNSTSESAIRNLFTLQKVLQDVGLYILGDKTALEAEASAIGDLANQLVVMRSTESGLAKQVKRIDSLTSSVASAEVGVKRLVDTFSNLKSGSVISEDEGGYKRVTNNIKRIETTLLGLQAELSSINTDKFDASLKAGISVAIARIDDLTKRVAEFKSQIATKISDKGLSIDPTIIESEKTFVRYSKEVISTVDQIKSGLNQLGSSVFSKTLDTQLSEIRSNLGKTEVSVTALKNSYDLFKKSASANIDTISISGVNTTVDSFKQLLGLIREYVSAKLVEKQAELNSAAAKKQDVTLINQEISSLQLRIASLNNLDQSIDKNRKAILQQAAVYSLYKDSAVSATAAARAAWETLNQSLTGSGKGIQDTVKEFDAFKVASENSSKNLDAVIRKLNAIKLAGGEIPEVLKSFTSKGKLYQFASLDELIQQLERAKLSIDTTLKATGQQFNVEPFRVLESELTKINELVTRQVTMPASVVEVVDNYVTSVGKLKTEFQSAATSVADFSRLQRVYTEYKQQLDGVHQSLLTVIDSFRVLNAKGIANIQLGNTTASVNDLIVGLEAARQSVITNLAAINSGLQQGGSSLDTLLLQTGRISELGDSFRQLETRVTAAADKLQKLNSGQIQVTPVAVKDLQTEINALVTERASLLSAVESGVNRLDTAYASALKTVGVAELADLQTAINTIKTDFGDLAVRIRSVDTSSLAVGSAPINKLVEAIEKANTALLGTSSASTTFATTFDREIKDLIANLEKASGQIGLMRTEFEKKPREVLQEHFKDLQTKAQQLQQAYTETVKAISSAELAIQNGGQVDAQSLNLAREQAEKLKTEIIRVAEAANTLKEIMSRMPEGTNILRVFENTKTTMDEVRDSGALLSKGMKSLFDLMIKQNAASLGNQMGNLAKNTDLVAAAMRELEDKMVTSLRNMDMMTMGLQMLGQDLVEPFKKSIETFSKFSDTLAFIQGATDATTAKMEELGDAAKLMGTTTRYNAEQAADGLKQLALAGYSIEEQIKVLPTVLQLATSAEMELGAATEIVVAIMSSQRMGVEELGKATDIMSSAAIKTTATLSDLGTAFKYAGALSGTLGNEIEDTAGALALLHNAGIKGSMAGTALRGSMQALLNPTREEAKTLDEVSRRLGGTGLQILNAQGKFVGFVSILKQFETAGLSTSEVLQLFGQRAGPGMASLLQMGSDKLESLVDELRNAEGATARLAATMESTLAGKMQILSNSLTSLGESVGESLSMVLKPLAEMATALVGKVMVVREELGALTPILDNLAAGFAILISTIGTVSLAWSMMLVPSKQFFSFLFTLISTVTKTASAIALLAAGGPAMASALTMAGGAAANFGLITKEAFAAAVAAGGGFKGLLVIIRALGLALVTTPWGLAITAITTVVGLALLFAENTKNTIAELDKQSLRVRNVASDFTSLAGKIADVGQAINKLHFENLSLDTSQFLNLPEVKGQKDKLVAIMQEIVTRYEETTDSIKKGMHLEKSFDPITGELTGLRVSSAETGEVITELSTSMLGSANAANEMQNAANKLNSAINQLVKIEEAKLAVERFNQVVRENIKILGRVGDERFSFGPRIADMKQQYDALLAARQDYNKAEEALSKAKLAKDEAAIKAALVQQNSALDRLQEVMPSAVGVANFQRFFKGVEIVNKELDRLYGKMENLKEAGAKFDRTVVMMMQQAIDTIQKSGKEVNLESVIAQVKEGLIQGSGASWLPTWMKRMLSPSAESQAAIEAAIRASFDQVQAAINKESARIETGKVLEQGFRDMQRTTQALLKSLGDQITGIGDKLEDLKKEASKYKENVDLFVKYRDKLTSTSKAALDVGLASVQRETQVALTQIQATSSATAALGVDTFGKLTNAAIGWGAKTQQVDASVFNSFAQYQGQRVTTAAQATNEIYSYYKNSLEKQIDDLERSSRVTENVYAIPVRLEVEEDFGKVVHTYVADAVRWTGELVQYTKVFNKDMLDSKIELEQKKLQLTRDGIDKERGMLEEWYQSQLPLYTENEEARYNLDKDYLTKKKELDARGFQATQAALDKIKELYKANADKIVQIEADKQAFINRLNKKRSDVQDASLNDEQKLAKEKSKASMLAYQAEQEALAGHLEKSKALFEKAQDEIEKINFQPWDKDTQQYIYNMTNRIEAGYTEVSDRLEQAGKSEQATLETTAKSLETTLSGYQSSLTELEGSLKKVGEALSILVGTDAKKAGVDLEVSPALEKIKAVAEAKHNLDLEFGRPIPILLDAEAAIADMTELARKQQELEKARDAAIKQKRDVETAQKELDATSDLLSMYRQLEALVVSIHANRLPANVGLGSQLKDVTKDGTEGAKQFEAINKALEDEEKALDDLRASYIKNKQVVPAILDEQIKKIQEAKDTLKPDSKGTVVVTQAVVDVLGQAAEKSEQAGKLTQQFVDELKNLKTREIDELNRSLDETLKKLEEIARQSQQLKEGRVGGGAQKGVPTPELQQFESIDKSTEAARRNTGASRENKVAADANRVAQEKLGAAMESTVTPTKQAGQALEDVNKKVGDLPTEIKPIEVPVTATVKPSDSAKTQVEEWKANEFSPIEIPVTAEPKPVEPAKAEVERWDANEFSPIEVPVTAKPQPVGPAKAEVEKWDANEFTPIEVPIVAKPQSVGAAKAEVEKWDANEFTPISIPVTPTIPPKDAEAVVQKGKELGAKTGAQFTDAMQKVSATPIKTTVEVGATKSLDDLRQVQTELNNLLMTSRNFGNTGVGVISKDQLNDLRRAKEWVDGLVVSSRNGVNVTVDADKLEKAKAAIDAIKQGGNNLDVKIGDTAKVNDLIGQLKTLGEERARLQQAYAANPDLVNLNNLQLSTRNIVEVKGQLEALRQQELAMQGTSPLPTDIPRQVDELSGALDTVVAKFANLAKTQPGYKYDVEPLLNQFKELDAQAQGFKDNLSKGVSIDPSSLDAFKAKFDEVMASIRSTPADVPFDTSDINVARGALAQLQQDLSGFSASQIKINSDPSEIKDALSYCDKLLSYDGRTSTIKIVTQMISQHNQGGLVGILQAFAKGGLAHIQAFARGGVSSFRRLASSVVPGSGHQDTVPAMLTPGEFVVRKPMVERYGLGFMNAINSGIVQFKALGGAINDLPNIALSGMQRYLVPTFNTPEMEGAGSGGPVYDVRLHIGAETVNIKSSRDEIKKLVSAIKQLDR